ncbi:hypothetical protein FQN52_008662 [Onygenales sp. PD_12]|nr:hypothetical protein FQN53_007715 [Emmonsiellopsis sp. PD_33]KAK2794304.1 hypothetical protein FQN52_008662 [Onygenales sp. PD_12]
MPATLLRWETYVGFLLGASFTLVIASLPKGVLTIEHKSQSPQAQTPISPKSEDGALETEPSNNDSDDGDIRTAQIALNTSVLAELQRAVQNTVPWADLSLNFIKWGRRYPAERHKLEVERSRNSQACRGSSTRKPPRAKDDFSIPMEEPEILRTLANDVVMLLQQHSDQDSIPSGTAICSALSSALKNGKVLWSHFGRVVVQLDEHIVVKFGNNITLTDADTTAHIAKLSDDIPAPRPLGVMSVGKRTYMFMTLVKGDCLGNIWSGLSDVEKISIRDQLDIILGKLRALPLPSQYLGGGNPPRCIDCRMWKRESPVPIENETQFNAFLLSGNHRTGRQPYVEFVRPMLRDDHHIVMTHGDLHPRNIMVIKEEGGIQVTGLIDWEHSGAYPEYWEFVKSLNTMFPVRSGDWCFFLPQNGMGAYCAEFSIDRFLENCVT